jgi:Centromere protein H (CENP-H)
MDEDELQDQLQIAGASLTNSKAAYDMNTLFVTSFLQSHPTLQAVHAKNPSPSESTLLPLLLRRDELALEHTNLSASLASTISALKTTESQNMVTMRENKLLADELLALAAEVKSVKTEDISDTKLREQVGRLEEDVRKQRTRWRIIKNVLSAVIVGSGLDWAGDEELRAAVLMDDEEDG